MRPKSGLPKRRALRAKAVFKYGFRDNPATVGYRHPTLSDKACHDAIPVVSLFAGCGGMDLGFLGGFQFLGETYAALPYRIIDAIDIDKFSIETYHLNIGSHARVGDLTVIPPEELPPCRVLIGGFPCQDFSSSGPKVGFAGARLATMMQSGRMNIRRMMAAPRRIRWTSALTVKPCQTLSAGRGLQLG